MDDPLSVDALIASDGLFSFGADLMDKEFTFFS